MITIANIEVNSLYGFSKHFFTFLGFIKGGYDWLNWATTQTESIVCKADDESQLLKMIQSGLHSDDTIKFNNFEMGIDKALSIQTADLSFLESLSNNNEETNNTLQEIQTKWNLLSNQQLQTNSDFLSNNNLSQNPIFTRLNLSDSVALYQLQSSLSKKKVNQNALTFASQKAATVEEFSDYYNFYTSAKAKCPKNMTIQQKQNICSSLFSLYDTLCNYLIITPNVGVDNSDQKLKEGLVLFVQAQKFIGFKTKAAAMLNLVNNVPLNNDYTLNEDAIENYMTNIKNLIVSTNNIPDCQLSQDGEERVFTLQGETSTIVIGIHKSGDIYILPNSNIKS